jgi:RNA polymerase sigma-70 factor (ECF subfamily)
MALPAIHWQFDTFRDDATTFGASSERRGVSRADVRAPDDDVVVLEQLRAGDERALTTIFARYLDPLVRFADLSLGTSGGAAGAAGDVVSDVLFSLWERRAELGEIHQLRSYLYRAVRNRALNVRRTEQRAHQRHLVVAQGGDVPGMASAPVSADETLDLMERMRVVWRTVHGMREPLRTIAILRWSHGLSFAEIGDILGSTEGTVRAQASRALAQLRESVPALLK